MKAVHIALVVAAVVVDGCTAAIVSPSPSDTPMPGQLAAVSRSNPGAEAFVALDACSLSDSTGRLGTNGLGWNLVVAMGLVPSARDVPKYAPFDGTEPELQTDMPAWVIRTEGVVQLPLAPAMTDPTCVAISGVGMWFGTGSVQTANGGQETARPPRVSPIYSLPSMSP